MVAKILSIFYGWLMAVVIISVFVQVSKEGWFGPAAIMMYLIYGVPLVSISPSSRVEMSANDRVLLSHGPLHVFVSFYLFHI